MTGTDSAPRRESAFALLRRLAQGMIVLGRLEITHARQEIGDMIAEAGRGLVLIGIAVALVFGALIAAILALILGLAAITGLDGWLMALLVVIALLLSAFGLGYLGVRRIRIGPPEETIASVQEEVAWAKRLLRRD